MQSAFFPGLRNVLAAMAAMAVVVATLPACGDSKDGGGGTGGQVVADATTGPDGIIAIGGASGTGGRSDGAPAGGTTPDARFIDLGQGGRGGTGGTGGATGTDGGQPQTAGLHIEPGDVTLVLGVGPIPTQQFTVTRIDAQGSHPVDPTGAIWVVTPADLGSVNASGLFTSGPSAGTGFISATFGPTQADQITARIVIVQLGNVIEPGTPPDAPAQFDRAPAGQNCGPTWIYPEPNTAIPSNLIGFTLQWAANGHHLYKVEFAVGGARIDWFVNTNELTPSGDNWINLLRSAGGQTMTVTVTGLGGQGDNACEGDHLPIIVDVSEMIGAIYYWSTTDFGIMRIPIGDLQPEPFLNPAVSPEINCPACHALSRDGQRIALTRTTFPPFGELFISAIADPRQPYYDPSQHIGYFPSFSPRGDRLVAGNGGHLVITDVLTGAEIERLPCPANKVAGEPDWSWTEEKIVAAYGNSGLENPIPDVGIGSGEIARWIKGANDATWSDPEVIVERDGDLTNDRPAYSPDGTWIAFQRSGAAAQQGQATSNASNALWIVPAAGGVAPIELANANKGLNMGNAWPKWAPVNGGGRLWLAFSSLRDYGAKLQQGAEPRPQLWVTGIDPNAPPGTDPSSPGFWLPGQNMESGNHIPYWAVYQKH